VDGRKKVDAANVVRQSTVSNNQHTPVVTSVADYYNTRVAVFITTYPPSIKQMCALRYLCWLTAARKHQQIRHTWSTVIRTWTLKSESQ
jgi:hypothetical protein